MKFKVKKNKYFVGTKKLKNVKLFEEFLLESEVDEALSGGQLAAQRQGKDLLGEGQAAACYILAMEEICDTEDGNPIVVQKLQNILEGTGENYKNAIIEFKKKLNSIGYDVYGEQNFVISKNKIKVAELRLDKNEKWIIPEMIYVDEKYRQTGIGTQIFTALLDASFNFGFDGLFAPAFDESAGTGQQRTPAATKLFINLVKINGGRIEDVSKHITQEFIDDLKSDDAPFYGPPYYDIYVNKSK